MNINIFLSIVFVGLSMIFFLFEPMNLKETDDKEIPQFSLKNFSMFELSKEGLITKMLGENAMRYLDRYIVENIDYTDNSKEFKTNMKANNGLYKDDIVYLNGSVQLKRDDGLSFFSQKLTYNKVKDIAYTDVEYTAYMGKNYIIGQKVSINNNKATINSKQISAVYNLKEENKQ